MFSFIKIDLGNINFTWNMRYWFKSKYNKTNIQILFVDDNDMPVVENLQKAGFIVKKVRDIKNIDDARVQSAQIIFVDYDGVGVYLSPQHQGAGLIKLLKIKYKKSKYIILYTEQRTMNADTIISDLCSFADARIKKDSDVTDYIDKINVAFKKLK